MHPIAPGHNSNAILEPMVEHMLNGAGSPKQHCPGVGQCQVAPGHPGSTMLGLGLRQDEGILGHWVWAMWARMHHAGGPSSMCSLQKSGSLQGGTAALTSRAQCGPTCVMAGKKLPAHFQDGV